MTRARLAVLIACLLAVSVGVVLVAYPTDPLGIRCSLAPGADLTGHPDTYPWQEVTHDLAMSVPVTHGRGTEDEQQEGNSESTLALKNHRGRYTTDDPMSDLWPNWNLNTPIKYETNTGDGSGWVTEWVQYAGDITDDVNPKIPRTMVTCNGLLRRLGQGEKVRSAMHRSMVGVAPDDYVPHAYWAMEDGAEATAFASALPGGNPVTPAGAEFAADDTLISSEPLPTFAATGSAIFPIPTYVDTGRWFIQVAFKFPAVIPTPPSGQQTDTTILEAFTSGGTVVRWHAFLRTTDTGAVQLRLSGVDAAGASVISAGSVPLGAASGLPTPDELFGHWAMLTLGEINDDPAPGEFSANLSLATKASHDTIFNLPAIDPGITGQIISAKLSGNALLPGYGHLGVWVDPAFGDADIINNIRALEGWAGEQAHERVERICRESRIPADVTATESAVMGPQIRGTIPEILRDCERTDHGLLNDAKGIIEYRALSELYNQEPQLTVNAAGSNELFSPYVPITDDQKRANKVTAKRPNGGSYTVENFEDINGVDTVRPGVGVYETDIEPNVDSDDALPGHASHIAMRVGAVPGRRYPSVSLDFLRAPYQAKARTLRLGDLVRIINAPQSHYDVDLLFLGWSTVQEGRRKVRLVANCASAWPYRVGVAGDGATPGSWLRTGPATALPAGLAVGATSLLVHSDGPLFTTDTGALADNPLELLAGGEVMPVSEIADAISDPFTRTVSSGWGSAPDGRPWVTVGGSVSEYAVDGSAGTQTLGSVVIVRNSYLATGAAPDVELTADSVLAVTPTGNSIRRWLAGRLTDDGDYYAVRLWVDSASVNATVLDIVRRVNGSLGTVTSVVQIGAAGAHTPGSTWRIRLRIAGSSIDAKAWDTASTEPILWQVSGTDTAITTGSGIGCLADRANGNTNTDPIISWDNAAVVNPQTINVTRTLPKLHATGTLVRVHNPLVAAL